MLDFQTALNVIFIAVITYAVTQGIKSLSRAVKVDLSGAIVPVIAAAVAALTAFSPAIYEAIPIEYRGVVATLVIALAGTFGSAGIHKTISEYIGPSIDAEAVPDHK